MLRPCLCLVKVASIHIPPVVGSLCIGRIVSVPDWGTLLLARSSVFVLMGGWVDMVPFPPVLLALFGIGFFASLLGASGPEV